MNTKEDESKTDVYVQQTWFIKSNQGKIEDYYDIDLKKKLGSGSYGCVFKAKKKESKIYRAIKMIPKNKVKNAERFKMEIDIMRNLDHPNIIKLYETFEDSRNIYLVMEVCEGGELFDRIIDKGQFTETQARIIFTQMLQAINYCHSNGIAHRDLKPENFLFLTKAEDSPIKVIDFGLSKHFDEKTGGAHSAMSTRAGTPYYISPEVLSGNYDESCDIWSSGVILYILLSGVPPFGGDSDPEILDAVKKGEFNFDIPEFKKISESVKDLIRKMITKPKERYKASEVLAHPWMKEDIKEKPGTGLQLNFSSLKNFTQSNKLKKVALTFIASQLSENEISDLGKLFRKLDQNGDGTLSIEEIKDGLSVVGSQSYEEILQVIQQVDTDGSGKIDYNEFIAASIEKSLYMKEEKLQFAFKMFDINGDGKISKAELKQVLGTDPSFKDYSDSYWDDIVNSVDQNGDGEIDYNEFIDMMSNINIQK